MQAREFRAIAGFWGLALLALGMWFLAKYGAAMPDVAQIDAPAAQFSAMRADATLARILGPEIPHPASTPENAAVRARILNEFAKMGVPATTIRGLGCNLRRDYGVLTCATVTDILAEAARGPGEGKAVMMMAHYDSVPAGPGASDDASSVATILETIRALRPVSALSTHPVVALITDGEEYGLLGAAAFLDEPTHRDMVGVAVNVEARGNQGPSILFQTSPGDGRLIDLYARSVRNYATSSLYEEIYKFLPNDTDLTLFLRDGITGLNFAFVGNVSDYHTPLDTRKNLSLATLQQHGENLLGVVSSLEHTNFASLNGGNDIYVDLFGRLLPRLPESWALLLSIVVFLMLALAAYLAHGEAMTGRQRLASFAMPLALIAGTTAMGLLLSLIAQWISGMPHPANAYPVALRIALALGVWGVAILVVPMANFRASVSSAWLWMAGLAIVTAAFLPGISPYFLFPSIVAAILLLASARFGSWDSMTGRVALLAAAFAALVLWIGLAAQAEMLMGLDVPPLLTVPAAFGILALLPLMRAQNVPRRVWTISLAVAFGGALAAAVVAGLQPAYSETAPLRLNLNYVEDHAKGRAMWAADANAPLPASLRAAANFGTTPEKPHPATYQDAYIAPAGAMRFAPPTAIVASAVQAGGRRVTLTYQGSANAAQMYLAVPKDAQLQGVTINGKHFDAPPEWRKLPRVLIGCMTDDCRNAIVSLDLGTKKAVELTLIERRVGLPDFGKFLSDARPKTAVPSQMGDGTYILMALKVPAL